MDETDVGHLIDRRLQDNTLSSGPPGAEGDFELGAKSSGTVSSKDSSSRSRRRESRSRSRTRSKSISRRRRRSRSKSRSYSPGRRRRRFEERDPRLRNRRSRSRERGRGRNRSSSHEEKGSSRYRSRRSRSDSRGRGRGGWSPPSKSKKKGPVSPPPPPPVQVPQAPPFGMVPQRMYPPPGPDQYGQYQSDMVYGANMPPNSQYTTYEYPVQPPPTFGPYAPTGTMQPVPPGDDFQQNQWQTAQMVPPPTMMVPPPDQQSSATQQIPSAPVQPSVEEKQKRDAAVAQEKKNQRATLRKQREDYKRRSNALKRELNILKEQRDDLVSGSEPPSPTTKGFLKENDRLQLQIENKIKTIENVIEMLTGIIGNDKDSPSPPPPSSRKSKKKSSKSDDEDEDDDSSPERLKSKVIESLQKRKSNSSNSGGSSRSKETKEIKELKKEKDENGAKNERGKSLERKFVSEGVKPANHINFVHYDPEMHWCKSCAVFPKTAKDYLTHLHSKEHAAQQKNIESPWHDKPFKDELATYPDAPTKRTPIRGLQFFVPSTGWYCKLCSMWMGDLHCASLHLKSKTHAEKYSNYAAQNPHFEVDWMADRQKAYESSREQQQTAPPLIIPPPPPSLSTPTPVPPPIIIKPTSNTLSLDPTDNIPLQLQQIQSTARHSSESDEKKKKKKNKKEEKREKKKKKRSKKRKQSSSSSSSSDSSDSDSDDDTNGKNDDSASQSIRVAMRNLLKQQQAAAASLKKAKEEEQDDDEGGKWTVVQMGQTPAPPPPTISENGANNLKKDELMIAQWNVREPIITEKEKKLLEQLKGRLKNQTSKERENIMQTSKEITSKLSTRRPSREKTRDERNRNRSRSRSYDRDRRSARRRSRSRGGRRSRSRSRTPPRWGRRRSRSRSPRSRSRSHSRSRSRGRRIEKPIVRYPEFRPRVPEKEKEKEKDRERDKRKHNSKSETIEEQSQVGHQDKKTVIVLKKPVPANKKLPFIGRMPVFKKQANDEEAKKEEIIKVEQQAPIIMQQYQHPHHAHYDAMQHHMHQEDYDDLMPDPMQFVSLMGAPPPPPMVPPPDELMQDKNEQVLPPGIDEAEADQVPKPISDAPLPRKGPLPQDFQDALSIIFPGERKQNENDPNETNDLDQMKEEHHSIVAEASISTNIAQPDEQQASLIVGHELYSSYSVGMPSTVPITTSASIMNQEIDFTEDVDIPDIIPPSLGAPPPPPPMLISGKDDRNQESSKMVNASLSVSDEKKASRMDELNDLALLGIDSDDLAAQCM